MEAEIIEQILAHMSAEGITPKEEISFVFDGRIHRFSTADDRHGKKSGAYYAYSDGLPNWGFMDYHKHSEMIKGKLDTEHLSWGARETIKANSNNYPKHSKNDNNAEEERARARAFDEYTRGKSERACLHPYIMHKHLGNIPRTVRVARGVRPGDICKEGDLLIPLVSAITRKFQTLERISMRTMADGRHMKGLYKGTHRKNACFEFPIPQQPAQVIICEGFATGASIYQFAKSPAIVLCATCWSNIINVARIWRKRTKLPIIIAADNDKPGIKGATDAVNAGYADNLYYPPIVGYDWNDYITR